MTVDRFLSSVESYYGQKYPSGQSSLIVAYLETKSDRALTVLFGETLKTFSSQYKTLPDIAVFEGLRNAVIERMKEERADQDLNRLAIESDTEERATPEQFDELFKSLERIGIKLQGGNYGDE